MSKRRLDSLLVERGLVPTREKARATIMAGQVLVAKQPATKAGLMVSEEAPLEVLARSRYVSRGGEKLEHALRVFGIDVSGAVCADIGASTGGFSDCLLQHGAARVYAVDVGYGQLDQRLRQDRRVISMERVNARELTGLPEPLDIMTIDVAFISLQLVLPPAAGLLKPDGRIVALLKPQFQAEREEVGKGGVIRDPLLHATLIGRFAAWALANGFRIGGLTRSPLRGPAGNLEFFFLLRPDR
ncbi:MAG TPA: TlyA family RNA methyltransferase [Dehalococcoidia bacterium]|nr:TlyA family RNA methyltransferase [Dehalococcoidia bacterium]